MADRGFYYFGRFRIDVAQRILLRDAQVVRLTPRAFDLLLFLVERPGQIVEKDTLMKKVWPDVNVEDANLKVNISVVRKALGGSRQGDRYIRNIFGRGYRFVAEVRWYDEVLPQQHVTQASQSAAFRGLVPFEPSDADRFYGRDIEASAIFDLVTHSEFRFGVLYGDSGCGKTSLIKAALVPRLEAQGFLVICCRSYKDPVNVIVNECQKLSRVRPRSGESPAPYVQRVAQSSSPGLIIVCDQFEDFSFGRGTEAECGAFIELVAACHNAAGVQVKFLFAIRADALTLIANAFDGCIPEALATSKRRELQRLNEEQTADVIEKSVSSANWEFDPKLCRQVARDLAGGGGGVLPSELQIVGEQLQNKRIFTLEQYRRAGGKEQLVQDYLEDLIKLAGDGEVAKLLLRCLISDNDRRLTLTLAEINKRVQRKETVIRRSLDFFIQSRLIRELQHEEPYLYELMHEYLIDKINRVTGKVMDETQRANRSLRRSVLDYSVDNSARIPLREWWRIQRYSDLPKGEVERELLKRSLRRGLARMVAVATTCVLVAGLLAAGSSWNDKWDEVVLTNGHTRAVRQAAFSPDGRLLVSVGEDARVIVWDFEQRMPLATLTDHTKTVTSVAFSPDGKWFATGGEDNTVIVWDAARLEKEAVLGEHQGMLIALAFSPDGLLLASASYESPPSNGRIILWNVGHWEKVHELTARVGSYGKLIFSPDSRRLISSGAQKWDVATGQQVPPDFPSPANCMALSPDSDRIFTMGGGGDVGIWDVADHRNIAAYRPHQDSGRGIAFSPDGRLVATGADDIVLWDAATMTNLGRLEYPSVVWHVAFSPDGRWLVSTHGDGAILIWNVAERKRVANFNGHSDPVRGVAFSPDGKLIASAGEDRSVILWNAATGRKEAVLLGHSSRLTGVDFSRDGQWIVSSEFGHIVILWDLAQRQSRLKFDTETGTYCVAISTDDRWVATTQGVYDGIDSHRVVEFDRQMYGVAFSHDGRWLACATPDQSHPSLYLLDTETWQLRENVEVSDAHFISVSFSPDNKHLVTGDDEGTVRLWEIEPLHQVALLGRHTSRIKSVAFSPDGKEVASAGDDRTIKLWDVNGHLVREIGTHTAPVLSVAFSPDGKRLVSGEHDHSVRVYTRHRTLWGYRLN